MVHPRVLALPARRSAQSRHQRPAFNRRALVGERSVIAGSGAAAALDPARLREPGSIPWYGEEYALDDLIVYQYYGHKREHSAQIEAFRDAATRQ